MTKKTKIKVSIAGGTGYTAGELLRILYQHPQAEVVSVSSTSKENQAYHTAHPDLLGLYEQKFVATPDLDVDVLFLCLGHGISTEFLQQLSPLPISLKIIDLSNDFRIPPTTSFHNRTFVYGLPELNRDKIVEAQNIANPGCFATAIQLALLPLAKEQLVTQDIHISAITGSSGAGGKLRETTHFSWRNDNISAYKEFSHQHLGEINHSLQSLQKGFNHQVHFLPLRGDFVRGIFASCYTQTTLSQNQAFTLYQDFYQNHPFVQVSESSISMKQATNTNRCILQIQVLNQQVLIHSAIDNLVKGASGQAIQNMNLIFNLPEDLGLHLKPNML